MLVEGDPPVNAAVDHVMCEVKTSDANALSHDLVVFKPPCHKICHLVWA